MRFQKISEHVAKINFPDGWVLRLHENDLKILLGDFSAKVGRENIFKPTIGNDILQQDSNDNVVRIVNFATSKFWVLRARYSHTFISTSGPLQMGRLTTKLITY
jgi:hypothetical protein